ncbi:MAG: hypothetical protein ACREUI_07635 [Burkholderiales bacterium]
MKTFSLRTLLASAALSLVLPAATFANIDQPPPHGFKTVYLFTGAKDNTIDTATVVHCTNFDAKTTTIEVAFFDFTSVLRGSFEHTLAPGETVTVGSRNTAFYSEFSAGVVDNLGQGSARVASTPPTTIICTAQMLDSKLTPPSFIVPLPGFDKSGEIR